VMLSWILGSDMDLEFMRDLRACCAHAGD